ncbi:MAG: flagellar basal body P-ring protein FlgI [Thermodesulfobacteriota bacterium]
MKFTHCSMLLIIIAVLLAPLNEARAVRLKDIASIKGIRANQLVGYGLVVGLDGTGDGNKTPFTTQALVNMLENMGIHVNRDDVKVKNVAGVMVTATLPPFVKTGQTIDITLSALGDAKSLQGGTLVATPLKALDGKVYAIGQGPVSIGGFQFDTGANDQVQANHLTVARVPDGATVEREVPVAFAGKQEIVLHLNSPDFTTMSRAVNAIDSLLEGPYASARDSATVSITVPEKFAGSEVAFMAAIENLEIIPDTAARVVIDERTGTIVMGRDVRIKELAVAHGNLSVQVSNKQAIPSAVENSNVTARDQENKLVALTPGVTLGDLVSALNSVGVTPRDLIAILQSIKAAGALDADLEII